MENMTQTVQTAPEQIARVPAEECPTCISGTDPTIGTSLFQEALRES